VTERVEVTVPGGIVYLLPRLSVPMAAGLMAALEGTPATEGSMTAMLIAGYLQPYPRGAITGWTLVNDVLEPEELTDESIARRLSWGEGGMEVAERCNELYAADLFAPLVLRRQKSSPDMPTGPSTSVTPLPGGRHPKRSKRSSLNGSAGMVSVGPAR
jgi:hypothetical protein